MKGSELKELGIEELEQKSRETRDELFSAKVKHATGQLENTAMFRFQDSRRMSGKIARSSTVAASWGSQIASSPSVAASKIIR